MDNIKIDIWQGVSLTMPPEFPYTLAVRGKEYTSHATYVLDMKIILTDKYK